MPIRKESLAEGHVYHVFNKSIADFKIFNNDQEFLRMVTAISYYKSGTSPLKFSKSLRPTKIKNNINKGVNLSSSEKIVEIIAYCLMPTHIHLVLRQLKENGISTFMRCILNSYARYFNIKHNRRGPLWEGRFKNVLVEDDEQLLHLTRYIHLNPVTAYLIDKPEQWKASSYREYILAADEKICEYDEILDIDPVSYKKFVHSFVDGQRELAKIKKMLLE